MILLIGINSDSILKHFSYYAILKKKKVVFLDLALLTSRIHLYDEYFTISQDRYNYKDFSGVLNRLTFPANDIHDLQFQATELLNSILNTKIKNVLNPIYHGVFNDSKLLQLSTLKTTNIRIPDSYILSKTKIIPFASQIKSELIFKSLSSIRSIVVKLDIGTLTMDSTTEEPLFLQHKIFGDNIRVHVIDNEAIAVKVVSNKIDYRYDDQRIFLEYDLPAQVQEECILIAQQAGLRFCGIDLIKTQDNDYYILEVNPCPGYEFYEEQANIRSISAALLKVLDE